MSLEDFESRYRDVMDEILNQLQTLNLLAAQIEILIDRDATSSTQLQSVAQLATQLRTKTIEAGESVQHLSGVVEEFLSQQ